MPERLQLLRFLTLLSGAASAADFGRRGFPPFPGDCHEPGDRISRVDVRLDLDYKAAVQTSNGFDEDHIGIVVTIPDQGKFHFRESAILGQSIHMMWIYLRGCDAEAAVHFEAETPFGHTFFGLCYDLPLGRECQVEVDLDAPPSFPASGETDYILSDGRYTVRVVYADGSRARMVFFTANYP
jgi:hypothetical protein